MIPHSLDRMTVLRYISHVARKPDLVTHRKQKSTPDCAYMHSLFIAKVVRSEESTIHIKLLQVYTPYESSGKLL